MGPIGGNERDILRPNAGQSLIYVNAIVFSA
jgi:hypothetical protein